MFVKANRFHDHHRPATVIVNNTTIINRTTEINNIRRETKNIAGAGSQRVVVNEGPGLESIQRESGKKVRTMAVHEAITQTPIPAEVKQRKLAEAQMKSNPNKRNTTGKGESAPSPAQPPKNDKVAPSPNESSGQPPGSAPKTPAKNKRQGPSPGKPDNKGKGPR